MENLRRLIYILFSVVMSLITANAQNVDDLLDKANIAYMKGDFETALKYSYRYRTEARPKTKTDSIVYYYAFAMEGAMYSVLGDIPQARILMEKAKNGLLKVDPNDRSVAVVATQLSNLYMHINNHTLARENQILAKTVFESIDEVSMDYVDCMANLSVSLTSTANEESLLQGYLISDVAVRRVHELLTDKKYSSYWSSMSEHEKKVKYNNIQTFCIAHLMFQSGLDIGDNTDEYIYSVLKKTTNKDNRFWFYLYLGMDYEFNNDMGMATVFYRKALNENKSAYYSYVKEEIDSRNNSIRSSLIRTSWFDGKLECVQQSKTYFDYISSEINSKFVALTEFERKEFLNRIEYNLIFLNRSFVDYGTINDYGYLYNSQLLHKGLLVRSTRDAKDAIIKFGSAELKAKQQKIDDIRKQLLTEKDSNKKNSLRTEAENLERQVMMEVRNLQKEKKIGDVVYSEVRKNLGDKDIAIEFLYLPLVKGLTEKDKTRANACYYALTLKKGYTTPHLVKIADEDQLKSLDKNKYYNSSDLYNLIWKPLEKELVGVSNVYFSADNQLHNIGIEYTPTGTGSKFNDKYKAYRLSSTRILVDKKKHNPSGKAVLYGGLIYDVKKEEMLAQSKTYDYLGVRSVDDDMSDITRAGVKYLPGSKREVEAISKLMIETKTKTPTVFMGTAGNEESVRSLSGQNIDILMFSTHGIFLSDNEKSYDKMSNISALNNVKYRKDRSMYSGLFMSGVNTSLKGENPQGTEDGYLMAKEIAGLDFFKVDLVTLSACETGLGESGGDGAFGLQRGFKLAGANSMLMSLWKVNDAATNVFMTNYFEHLLSGHTKLESLRYAQEKVRETSPTWQDPTYWAAFVLLDGLD